MSTLTQPLHDEHRELLPHIDRILEVADGISAGPGGTVPPLHEIYNFLAHHLLAHARAEEAALYPVVQQALGSADATRTMSRDHAEIRSYIEELEALKDAPAQPLSGSDAASLRRVLYGLHALLKLHFAKEEEVYLPILDAYLSPESARNMFENMEAAAAVARRELALAQP